jgi:hypothetical protein
MMCIQPAECRDQQHNIEFASNLSLQYFSSQETEFIHFKFITPHQLARATTRIENYERCRY